MLTAPELLASRRFAEAVAACKQVLSVNPNDFATMGRMALALRALERYEEALPLLERIGAHEKECEITPGHPGRQMDISCLCWFLGNRRKAIALMRGLVDGMLDGSIGYGDAAGGMQQGLLLYYMAVTERQPDQAACALDYMRNRLNRLKRLVPGHLIESWPAPVARYYLGEIAFDELLVFATGERELPEATAAAEARMLSRRQLCVALFHDGTRNRAQGAEDRCLARMRQCFALKDPLIEPEWYLARHEVAQATAKP
jgi:tetratricopeptide (TPR) repeat protein